MFASLANSAISSRMQDRDAGETRRRRIDFEPDSEIRSVFVKTKLIPKLALAFWFALGGAAFSSPVLLRAPFPQLSDFADDVVTRYQDENHKPVAVKIAVVVQEGAIVNSQTYRPSGVPVVDEAVRRWILYRWKFADHVSGRFAIPLEIRSQLGLDPVRKFVIFR
jgi:hypothetical protein